MFELFSFTKETLLSALEIMGVGMGGLFLVMIIIALVVVILNQIDKHIKNDTVS